MKQSLPWESVPPPIYPAQSSLKPRKKWVQTGGWILVVVLLLFGISTRSRNPLLAFVSLAFSVLYLLTLMTKKDAALTSRGLEIFYDMQFTTNYEFFPWEDINAIVCEDRGHADMVRLHIGHGNTEKAPSQREPLSKRESFRFCQSLPLRGRWHRVSDDGRSLGNSLFAYK